MMFNKKQIFACVAALLLLPAFSIAQETNSQTWYGILHAGALDLRMELKVKQDDVGNQTATLISLDQGATNLFCDEFNLTDDQLTFKIKLLAINYHGKLNEAKDEAKGTFQQGDAKFAFTLKKVSRVPVRNHIQTWTGKMKAGLREFDFQFRVYRDEDGEMSALMDSFTENLVGIGCKFEDKAGQITINVPIGAAPATFIGTLSEDKKIIEGHWEQSGQEFPLVLKSVPLSETRELTQNRPQTPKPPFDYDIQEINVENKKEDVTLAGTLTTPPGDGPFPVVVMISGSGPQDRDETIFGHKSFFVIADHLTKNGIGVFRYDDRGTAKSTGDFATATTADFANDVDAVIDELKTLGKVDPHKIFLCGHSEGGIIAPMIACRRSDLAGIILLAGPGVNGRRISVNQSRLLMDAAGSPEYMIKIQETMLEGLYDRQEEGGLFDDEFLDKLADKMKEFAPDDVRESFDASAMINAARQAIKTPWFAFFAAYDPAPALMKTQCPVLAIVGEKDTQVDPKLNMPVIEKSLKEGGNSDYELQILPNLNHLFQNCRTGAISEYARIEETFAPSALDLVTKWLKKRVK